VRIALWFAPFLRAYRSDPASDGDEDLDRSRRDMRRGFDGLSAQVQTILQQQHILGNSPRVVEKTYSQWIAQRQTAIDLAVKATW